ncbi:PucR family transcriptional regulator [Nocardia sp. NPDC004068]|uniref:PucR family transcriptional regulator n=1 Tax=Nocardia sp. NPDC004068 TaxID=3364303 RepID=UPI003677BF59
MATALAADFEEIDGFRIRDVAVAMCQSNARRFLTDLARSGPNTIDDADERHDLIRELYRRSVPQQLLFRVYRDSVGHAISAWSKELARREVPTAMALAAVDIYLAAVLRLLGSLDSEIADDYESERIRVASEWSLARLEVVRGLLADDKADIAAASNRLGYRLSGRHVAAVLADAGEDGDSGSRLERAVEELQKDAGSILTVRVDLRTVWCWMPELSCDEIESIEDVKIGVGLAGEGMAGFRRSHWEALEALRVAELMPSGAPSAICFREAEIVALCTTDPERARDFIRHQLGPLVEDTEAARRMRGTLAAFYAKDCNYRATAAELNLHHNTVRYRIDQIEELLGGQLMEEKLAKHLALRLFQVFGTEGLNKR